jgi:hypothetical protein
LEPGSRNQKTRAVNSLSKKNSLFYQSICHALRLLKIPQVTILGDLHCLKDSCFFFRILVQPHCLRKLPAKLRALTHSPSLLANGERLWTFDLDKSQVRRRYSCVRDIRRSHCRPFCAHMSTQLEWIHACTLLTKRNCQDFLCLSCVCFWHWRVFNSNIFYHLLLEVKLQEQGDTEELSASVFPFEMSNCQNIPICRWYDPIP